jgi:predicted flap endonuclease-1-like 5' DNA nuclease
MPELTAINIGILAGALVVGLALGWVFRGERSAKEKIAINAGWQDQLESVQAELDRLAEQNVSLMEQISQYQASQKDSVNRAKELSDSLRETFKRRDELQRQLKDFRVKLPAMTDQRDKLQSAIENREIWNKRSANEAREKDDKIFHLSRELTSWQSRVPPLVEKFQERDKQARALEEELKTVRARIESFEEMARANQTRIEPVDTDSLLDGMDASNEPHSDTSAHAVAELQDQIHDEGDSDAAVGKEPEAVEEFTASDNELLPEDIFVEEDDDETAGEPDADTDSDKAEDDLFTSVNKYLEDDLEPGDDKDDLKQIKGVGPVIEKTLNELGILLFSQVAEMSEYEIDRIAQRLKGFRSRIYREDWIGQARDLQFRKSNNQS